MSRPFKPMDHNAVGRSVAMMGFNMQRMIEKRRTNIARYALSETEQQFQQEFTVNPSSTQIGQLTVVTATIMFTETIVYAPRQRQSNSEDPQMWFGAVLDIGEATVTGHVSEWVMDEAGNFIGAVVSICVTAFTKVQGTAHFTFQGLSSPIDDPGLDDGPS